MSYCATIAARSRRPSTSRCTRKHQTASAAAVRVCAGPSPSWARSAASAASALRPIRPSAAACCSTISWRNAASAPSPVGRLSRLKSISRGGMAPMLAPRRRGASLTIDGVAFVPLLFLRGSVDANRTGTGLPSLEYEAAYSPLWLDGDLRRRLSVRADLGLYDRVSLVVGRA